MKISKIKSIIKLLEELHMATKRYDKQFKEDAVKYFKEHKKNYH